MRQNPQESATAVLGRIAQWLIDGATAGIPLHPVERLDMGLALQAGGVSFELSDEKAAEILGLHPQTVRHHRRGYREGMDPDAPRLRVARTRRGKRIAVDNLWISPVDTRQTQILSESPALTSPARVASLSCSPSCLIVVVPGESGPAAGREAPAGAGGVRLELLTDTRPDGAAASERGDRVSPAPMDAAEDAAVAAELREECRGHDLAMRRPPAPLAQWTHALAQLRADLGSRDRAVRIIRAALAHRPPEWAGYRVSYGVALACHPLKTVRSAWWLRAVEAGWNGCPSPDSMPGWVPYNPPMLVSHAEGAPWRSEEGRAAEGAARAEWEGYISDLQHERAGGELGAAAELAAALSITLPWAGPVMDGAAAAAVRWADPEREYGATWKGIAAYRRHAARGNRGLVAWLARADRLAESVFGAGGVRGS